MKLRVGIIGLGSQWDSRYLPALRSLADRFEVIGICEQVAHLAQGAANALNTSTADGFRSLIARDDIDAVLYLANHWFGTTPVTAACEHGKAVYSAVSLPDHTEKAGAIRLLVEQSGIVFMAELPRRHAPATIRLKELIATKLGPPRMLFCHRRVPKLVGTATRQEPDATIESHELFELVDWCCYVVGSYPKSVFGVQHIDSKNEMCRDYNMLSMEFASATEPENRILAQVSCGRYMQQGWDEAVSFRTPPELQVVCRNGIAFVDLPNNLVWFDNAGRHQESLDSERPVGEHMLLQFHRKVTSLIRPNSDLEDSLEAMRVVHAATQSQNEGQRIALAST
ncbi:MAG: Gfo/Idh/MocA family oxidoreductase [Pirellulales bacterium]